jgi:hypothetical protein
LTCSPRPKARRVTVTPSAARSSQMAVSHQSTRVSLGRDAVVLLDLPHAPLQAVVD